MCGVRCMWTPIRRVWHPKSFFELIWQKLLRYIDDFLLITPSLSIAERFVSRMNEGFPAYGAYVSPGKTLLSFEFLGKGRMEEVFVQGD